MTCVYVVRNLSYSSVAQVDRISQRCFLTCNRGVCCAHSNQKHQTQKRRAPPACTLKGAEHRPQTRRGHETCHWFGVEADSRHFKSLRREASFQRGTIQVILGRLVFVVVDFEAPPSTTCTEECLLKTRGKTKPVYFLLISSIKQFTDEYVWLIIFLAALLNILSPH